MRRMKLSALFLVVALGVAAVGSAALTTINLDRNMTVDVVSDTDVNAAVQFSEFTKYPGLLVETGGVVSLDLNQAINDNATAGFNPNAVFTIDDAFTITNNSDIAVVVSSDNVVTLAGSSGSLTIPVGGSSTFDVTINTAGTGSLVSVLSVNQAAAAN